LNSQKKILFISYDGLTDPLGQSQIIPYLIGLTKYGYQFTILSCEKPEKFLSDKALIKEILAPYPIQWVPIPYHKKPPVFSSVYDVIQLRRKAGQLHKKEHFDLVHTRAGIPALIGLWMKNKFGVKFLHDIREFFAESRVDGGMWKKENVVYRQIYNYFKKREDEQIDKSDGIVCLTYTAEKIIKKLPCYKKEIPVKVIPCSVDMDLFDPAKIDQQAKLEFIKDFKISEQDLIISYLGSIGGWYLTDQMMMFCKIISDKFPSAKFLFISPHQHETIYKQAEKCGLQREKIIVTHAKRKQVPVLLSLSDYSLFFIKPCYSKLSSSPTKHGEIMAMGIPVITNAGVGDVEEIVTKYNSGIVLKELNEKEFHRAILLLSKENNFDSKKIRSGALAFYNLENSVMRYHEIYSTIFSNKK
jgi:glycosyltransferase involved in cell wall biosynthesis